MAGAAGADFLIGRIGRVAAGIADRGDDKRRRPVPRTSLGAPEAAEAEHGLLDAFRIRALERAMIDEMLARGADRRRAAGQRLGALGMATFLKPNIGIPLGGMAWG